MTENMDIDNHGFHNKRDYKKCHPLPLAPPRIACRSRTGYIRRANPRFRAGGT